MLVSFFSREQRVMDNASADRASLLQSASAAPSSPQQTLGAELLTGRKESMYWSDVPRHARFPKKKQQQQQQQSGRSSASSLQKSNKSSKRKREQKTDADETEDGGFGEPEVNEDPEPGKHVRF